MLSSSENTNDEDVFADTCKKPVQDHVLIMTFSLRLIPAHFQTSGLSPYHEGGTGPGHGGQSAQVGGLAHHVELLLPNGEDFFFEGVLPGVQLQDFDAVQDLVH